jgi:outer membrane protein assembly factor BamB
LRRPAFALFNHPVASLRFRALRDAATAGLVALMAALGGMACPRPLSGTSGCSRDTDCRGQRICAGGQCQEPPAGSAAWRSRPAGPPLAPVSPPPHKVGAPPLAMARGDQQNTGRLAGPAPERAVTEQWRVSLGKPIVGAPTIGPGGTLYVGGHDGRLHAISPAGALLWSFATADRVWSTPAVASDGTVYIGSDDDHLYAVDGRTGTEKWRYRIGACEPPIGFGPTGVRCDVDGGPKLGPDGTIYTGGDGVYAVWPDGTLRWRFTTPEPVRTAPALAADGTVYAGCLDDALYALGPDGSKLWEFRSGGDIESSPAIGPDGTIYFGSDDGMLYALGRDGSVQWKVMTRGDVRSSPALGPDGIIYVGSHDHHLYAIAPDGVVKWRFAAADKIHGAPGVAQNGVVLFGSQDDHLYALAADGRLLWYFAFDGDVDATPSVSSEGVVYAASDDGTVRALR